MCTAITAHTARSLLGTALRRMEQLERRPSQAALVEELGLVHAAEPSHAQLALRIVQEERLAEQHDAARSDSGRQMMTRGGGTASR